MPFLLLYSYLVPGVLVQVHAAVQRDSLDQLHGEHPAARQLLHQLGDLEQIVPLQHRPVRGQRGRKTNIRDKSFMTSSLC